MKAKTESNFLALGILLVLVQSILCLAMLPMGRGLASATFACLGARVFLARLPAGPTPGWTWTDSVEGLHDCVCPGGWSCLSRCAWRSASILAWHGPASLGRLLLPGAPQHHLVQAVRACLQFEIYREVPVWIHHAMQLCSLRENLGPC